MPHQIFATCCVCFRVVTEILLQIFAENLRKSIPCFDTIKVIKPCITEKIKKVQCLIICILVNIGNLDQIFHLKYTRPISRVRETYPEDA